MAKLTKIFEYLSNVIRTRFNRPSAPSTMYLRALTILLVLFHIVFLYAQIDAGPGVFMTIGKGILDGQLPYIDYYDHKPPGIYLTLASSFSIFESPVSAKLLVFLVNLTSAEIVRRISSYLEGPKFGLIATIFFLSGSLVYGGPHVYSTPFVAFFGLLATAGLLFWNWRRSRRYLFIAGLFTGISTVFKQTALAFFAAFVVYLLLVNSKRLNRRGIWLDLVVFLGGFTVLFIPILMFYHHQDALDSLFYWTVFIHFVPRTYGGDPFSILVENIREINNFPLLWAGAVIGMISSIRRHVKEEIRLISIVVIAGITPMFLHGWGYYYLQALPFGAILCAYGLKKSWVSFRPIASSSDVKVAIVVILLIMLLPFGQTLAWVTTDQIIRYNLTDDKQIGKRVNLQTAPDEPILVLGEEAEIYFLADRKPMSPHLYYLTINRHLYSETNIIQTINQKSVTTVVIGKPCQTEISRVCTFVRSRFTLVERNNHMEIYSR